MPHAHDLVDALLHGHPGDRVLLHDAPSADILAAWESQGYPPGADPVDHFDYAIAECGGWFGWCAGPDDVVAETPAARTVRTGNGALLRWWAHQPAAPEHLDYAITSRAIWERDYRPRLTTFDPARVDVAGAATSLARRRAQGRWACYAHQFLWENLRATLGDERMLFAIVDEPGWIHDFCRVYTDLYKAAFAHLFAHAGKPDGIWLYDDLGYRNRLFCSPATLERLIFPYYTELVDFFHAHQLPVIFHTCGCQAQIIPQLIAAGFDALNPMEARAGNDLFAFADLYGDRIAFIGGFDARLLDTADEAAIRAAVYHHIEGLRQRGARFVFGTDHALVTTTPYRAYQTALAAAREW